MDYSIVLDFIENVGFAIFAFLLMYKMVKDQQTAHAEEMDKMREAIDNNTMAVTRLLSHFENYERKQADYKEDVYYGNPG